jgi:hypothetical protein
MRYTVKKTVDYELEVEAPTVEEALARAEQEGIGNWTHVDEHVTSIEDEFGEPVEPEPPTPEWAKYDPETQWLCLIEHVGPGRRTGGPGAGPFLDGLAVPRTSPRPLTQAQAIGIRDRAMSYAVRTHGGDPRDYIVTIRGRRGQQEDQDLWMFNSKIGCRVPGGHDTSFPAPYEVEK